MNRKRILKIIVLSLIFSFIIGLLLNQTSYYSTIEEAYDNSKSENSPLYSDMKKVFTKTYKNEKKLECRVCKGYVCLILYKEKNNKCRILTTSITNTSSGANDHFKNDLSLTIKLNNPDLSGKILCDAIDGKYSEITVNNIKADDIYYIEDENITVWFYENAGDEIVNSKSEIVFKE